MKRRIIRLMMLLVLTFFVMCTMAVSDSYTVFVSKRFDADQTENIIASMDAWERAVSVTFTLVLDECPDTTFRSDVICVMYSSAAELSEHCSVAYGVQALGCTSTHYIQGSSDIRLAMDMFGSIDAVHEPYFRTAVMHEIGHALGLKHTQDPNDLMFPGDNWLETITCNDAKQYTDLRDLPPVKWCSSS